MARTEPNRKILHGKTQTLSKSEIVAQRITGHVPKVAELMDSHWTPCAPEYLGVDIAKTAARAEHMRRGDYRFIVGYRPKGKREDAEVTALIINGQTREELRANGWWMGRIMDGTQKERILNYLYTIWTDQTVNSWARPQSAFA